MGVQRVFRGVWGNVSEIIRNLKHKSDQLKNTCNGVIKCSPGHMQWMHMDEEYVPDDGMCSDMGNCGVRRQVGKDVFEIR